MRCSVCPARCRHYRAELGVTGRTREVMVGGLTSVEICADSRHVGNAFPSLVARDCGTAIASALNPPFSESIRETHSRQRLPCVGSTPSRPLKHQC
jgi:hypothetical protein